MIEERRKHCRYAFVTPVRVLTRAGERAGSMLDVSRDGAQIVASIEAAVGTSVFLTFVVADREAEAIGSVIRVEDHGGAPCFGLHFYTGNEVYVDLITALDGMPEAARAHELSALRDVVLQLGS